MRRLIDQLMVFAQTLAGGRPVLAEPVDLHELVKQVVQEARHTTKHPIELDCTLDQPVLGDPDKLMRLVENLVLNAIRHGEGTVSVQLVRDDTHAKLAIHNGGPAIPEDQRAALFAPFTRTKESGGVGLGLYIVDQIARAHRGTVRVESSEQAGTTFTVRLPLVS